MGVAEPLAHDGHPNDGFFYDVLHADTALFDFSVECALALDFLLAGPVLFCGFDRNQRRPLEEGLRCEIRFPNRRRPIQYDQFLSVHDSSGFAGHSFALSVSLDMDLSDRAAL